MLHRKGQNKYWTDLSLLGQEPTFKTPDFMEGFEDFCLKLTIRVFFNEYMNSEDL